MNFSAAFIRRPVMAVLLNLALILAGVIALTHLPVAALPSFETPVINVTAALPGASPETMASSVALPLEKQFATIPSLAVISSSSTLGSTSLTLEFDQDRNIDAAAVDVQAALLRAQRALPPDMTTPPAYRKVNPADAPVLLLSLTSPSLSATELNDQAEHLLSPSLATLPGVAQVQIFGQKRYAVRVRVLPDQLSSRNIGLDELATALSAANANTPVGTIDGAQQTLTLQANAQLRNAADFSKIIIATRNGSSVRLSDVARVEDSLEVVKSRATFNGQPSITLAVQRQTDANTVEVVRSVKAALPALQAQMPASIQVHQLNDRSQSILNSVHDVSGTLVLTLVLVIMVIFVFLHRVTATLIPALSLPVSLFGAVAMLWGLGDSLDNISLLGLTMAVGLVVDDAIVVLENIMRHVEDGMPPVQAALRGSREIGFTIASMSTSLVAVFIPLFFMPGVIGLLFHEFAVVVTLAIFASAFVSLTLVPMLASRLLHDRAREEAEKPGRLMAAFVRVTERGFLAVRDAYLRSLDKAMAHQTWVLLAAVLSLALTAWLITTTPKGFFPNEDIGQISASTEAAPDVSFTAMTALQDRVVDILRADPAVSSVASVNGGVGTQNTGRLFINLQPLGQRSPMPQVLERLRRQLRAVSGITVYLNPVQDLRLGGRQTKSQYQFVMRSVTGDQLDNWAERLRQALSVDPLFRDVTSDAQTTGLQASLKIDRDRANALGVSMEAIRTALYSAFGDRQVSTIYTPSDSYEVILELAPETKTDEHALDGVFVRSTTTNTLVPVTAFATVVRNNGPMAINHVGQLQAVTLSFNLAPNVPLGEATQHLDSAREAMGMPSSVSTSYAGDAAVFASSQASQLILIGAALLVIYGLLGLLYESYIHPLTILAGLPSAAVGALITLRLAGMDLTLIATIGILLLIGIVKKNAIMMIDFALDAQRSRGLPPPQAIREACMLRFRPIMMTTLAALMGALSVALGHGAGSELRRPLGVVVTGGLIFSQAVTLYITPVIYLALDRWSGSGPLDVHETVDMPAPIAQQT